MSIFRKIKRSFKKMSFDGSTYYWQRRYQKGRNSGSGSYGKHAEFKAEFLNSFCAENDIKNVIEFGCGDGNQLSLAKYPQYTGIDVSPVAIELCMAKFANDKNKNFFAYHPAHFIDNTGIFKADLALSLDVIFHLVEDDVYENYMQNLFAAAENYVIILSSDKEQKTTESLHVRHHKFTDYVAKNFSDWQLITTNESPYPEENFTNFYVYKLGDS